MKPMFNCSPVELVQITCSSHPPFLPVVETSGMASLIRSLCALAAATVSISTRCSAVFNAVEG